MAFCRLFGAADDKNIDWRTALNWKKLGIGVAMFLVAGCLSRFNHFGGAIDLLMVLLTIIGCGFIAYSFPRRVKSSYDDTD